MFFPLPMLALYAITTGHPSPLVSAQYQTDREGSPKDAAMLQDVLARFAAFIQQDGRPPISHPLGISPRGAPRIGASQPGRPQYQRE